METGTPIQKCRRHNILCFLQRETRRPRKIFEAESTHGRRWASPEAKFNWKCILAQSYHCWKIYTADITGAYLNARMVDDVYICIWIQTVQELCAK